MRHLQNNKNDYKRPPIGVSLAVGIAFKSRRERMVFKVVEDHVMMGWCSQTIKSIHTPRWSISRLGMKGGEADRASDRGGKDAGTSEGQKDSRVKCRNKWQRDHASIEVGNRRMQMTKGGWHDKGQ